MSVLTPLLSGLAFPEGPRWHAGRLWLSDVVNGRVLRHESLDQLVDPRRPLKSESVRIHGITAAMVAGQPTIDTVLPLGKKLDVGMINWGFVVGKTQTDLPWDSWQRPYTLRPPVVWHHELLRPDGTAYRAREIAIIKALSDAPKKAVPSME